MPLKSDRIEEIYQTHAIALERFLLGILRDEATAADALQVTFVRLMEKGHQVQKQSSIKSWLFRVAFNEAMLIKRRASTGRKHAEGIAWLSQMSLTPQSGGDERLSQSVHHAIQQEDVHLVRSALQELPEAQREVVIKRIYEGLKFREIAEQLDVPLGTVLARMQAALKKLKPILSE